MNESQAVAAFGALAQATRLRILRLLIVAGPDGLPAGVVAQRAGVSASNFSFHVRDLEQAGLIAARRASRSIIYSVRVDALNGLIRFLLDDCCGGQVWLCVDGAANLAPGGRTCANVLAGGPP